MPIWGPRMTALTIEKLEAGYVRDLPILRNVDLTADHAKLTVIIGPNGAGKSTLIKAIAGLVPVSAGRVSLDGQDITGLRPDLMGEHGLAYVPQTDNIFRYLTIHENLALVLRRAGPTGPRGKTNSMISFPCSATSRASVPAACRADNGRCWRWRWHWPTGPLSS